MNALEERLRAADLIPTSVQWEDVLAREPGGIPPRTGPARPAIVALLVAAIGIGISARAFLAHRGGEPAGPVPWGRIAFVAGPGRTGGDIYVAASNGKDVRRLTTESHGEAQLNDAPAWSPDGTSIAFSKGLSAIVVMGADGSHPREIDHNYCGGEDYPTWSPDGAKIAFAAQNPCAERSGVYFINADGTGARLLVQDGTQPAWSPDGRRIAFARFQTESRGAIYVINVDGSGLRRLTNPRLDLGFPSWSPDGSRLVASGGGRQQGIYVMNSDGSDLHRIIANGFDPAWSPDGTRIAFARANSATTTCTPVNGTPVPCPSPLLRDRLFVMNADGTDLRELPFNEIVYNACCPAWRPLGTEPRPTASTPSSTPSEAVPSTVVTELRGVLRELGPLCDRSSVEGDFDGDGTPDLAAIAAKRPSTGCPAGSAPRRWVLAVAWSSGARGSWPLPACGAVQPNGSVTPTGACQAFAAPDINGDGRAELAVKTLRAAGSISGLQFYELLPTESPKAPVEVAAGGPGPGSIVPGQVFVITFGSSPGYKANLRCEIASDGSRVLVSTDAATRGSRWVVHEVVWRFDGGQIGMRSQRNYSIAKDSSGAADLIAGRTICGAAVNVRSP